MPDLKTIIGGAILLFVGASLTYLYQRLGKIRDQRTTKANEALEKAREEEKEALRLAREEVERVRKETEETKKEIAQLQHDMAILRVEAVPVQAAFLAFLTGKVTNFHTPETDALIAQFSAPIKDFHISDEEFELLKVLMKEREVEVNGRIDEYQRICAKIYTDVIRLNVIDQRLKAEQENMEVVLVSQPAAPEEAAEKEEEDEGADS